LLLISIIDPENRWMRGFKDIASDQETVSLIQIFRINRCRALRKGERKREGKKKEESKKLICTSDNAIMISEWFGIPRDIRFIGRAASFSQEDPEIHCILKHGQARISAGACTVQLTTSERSLHHTPLCFLLLRAKTRAGSASIQSSRISETRSGKHRAPNGATGAPLAPYRPI